MLNFVASVILSVTIVGGAGVNADIVNLQPYKATNSTNSTRTDGSFTFEEPEISTAVIETSSWRAGVIGRHQDVQILDYEYSGVKVVEHLTGFYYESILDSFVFTREVSQTYSTTVSVSEQFSSEIVTAVGVQAGLGVQVTAGLELHTLYSIENTVTYSYEEKVTHTVTIEVKRDKVKGEHFALCLVAPVYTLHCKTWQWDDYWWGDYVVSGSEHTFDAYLIYEPSITIVTYDGRILY